jgi:DNA-binding CsgD family transcriptional regulator
MKDVPIVVVIKNAFHKSAVRHVMQEINLSHEVAFRESLHECLSGNCTPEYLVLDSALIPEPVNYSLERLRSKNSNMNLLLIHSVKIDASIAAMADETVSTSEEESAIIKKFKHFFSPDQLKQTTTNDNTLSDREVEVVQLVALGKTNKEISDTLHISTHTVITHRKNITSKLGIKTIAGLAVYAVLNGLIDPDEVNK